MRTSWPGCGRDARGRAIDGCERCGPGCVDRGTALRQQPPVQRAHAVADADARPPSCSVRELARVADVIALIGFTPRVELHREAARFELLEQTDQLDEAGGSVGTAS